MSKSKENTTPKKKEAKKPLKMKSAKQLAIETGIRLFNRIPDMISLMATAALTEVVRVKVRELMK